jgi:ketosteroid isomerase-like protein
MNSMAELGGLPPDVVDQYYQTVNFAPPKGFDAASWAAWLAPDYIYVSPAGETSIGKDAAVSRVTEDFKAYQVVQCVPAVTGGQALDASTATAVLQMAIAAVTTGNQALGVRTTVFLLFRKSGDRWLVTGEVAVPRKDSVSSQMSPVTSVSDFVAEFHAALAS